MESSSNTQQQQAVILPKIIYSAPASPAATTSSNIELALATTPTDSPTSFPVSGVSATAATTTTTSNVFNDSMANSSLVTPKKSPLDADVLQRIRETLKTPGGACELHSLRLERTAEPVNVIKGRYLISTQPSQLSPAAAARTPVSYRHLIDLSSSNLRCTDIFTEEQFLCKIINEPLHKVQRAYFQLQQEADGARSTIYGHALIRGVHDIVPLSSQRTYVIIAALQVPHQVGAGTEELQAQGSADGVYEDLHTYIRNRKRLSETEARALFHQICETVQVCHRNGIILRDLKLKRFYFIDEARTQLQYESLEGSMILDDSTNDTLSDKIGCPLYTAPELLCPNPTYRGKPADMWSLGVILYTMLVGQYPFYEKGNCNLITIIRHCQVQIPSSVSKSARWLLLQLLRKNYTERMEAEYIFYAPWLKEQQRSFYEHFAVDNFIYQCALESQSQSFFAPSDELEDTQPLDYSRHTLQTEQFQKCEVGGGDDVDVEMG